MIDSGYFILIGILGCLVTGRVCSAPENNKTETVALHARSRYNVVISGVSFTCDPNSVKMPRSDYQHIPGVGTHKFHTKTATFNEARKICQLEGGHLAVVDSMIEELVLRSLATRSGPVSGYHYWSPAAWVGLHNLYAWNEWVTILNDPLDSRGYNTWATIEPNNAGGNERCGSLIYQNLAYEGFNDLPCDVQQPFWCEIPEVRIV